MSDNYFQVVSVPLNTQFASNAGVVPTELMTTWINTCTPGLLKKSASTSGDISTGDSFSVDNNGNNGYINSFKLISDEVPVENNANNANNAIIFVILVVNGSQEIYATNGTFNYDKINKVVYTSPKNVFKRVDQHSEYVPHWSMFLIQDQKQNQNQNQITQLTLQNVKDVSKSMTSETGNILYYLNCLSNAFEGQQIDSELLKKFLSIMMVEIKLGEDYNLNCDFLKKLVSLGINTQTVKKPVTEMLSLISSPTNPYEIYINGLDLPLMLLQMEQRFNSIVLSTFNNYSYILNATKPIIQLENTKPIISRLKQKVQTQTKRAECFIMLNSKKTVAGGKKNDRFKYATQLNDQKQFLVLSAACSMKRLYDKDGNEIEDSFDTSANGKKTIKIDGSSNKRDLNGIFGPFQQIYDTDKTNSQIANSDEMLQLLMNLMVFGILFIIGWGASGGGKTSKLVYFNKGSTDDERFGIIIQMCKLLKTHAQFINRNSKIKDEITVRRVELCPTYDKSSVYNISPPKYACKRDETKYEFTWISEKNDFICNKGITFTSSNPERLNKEGIQCDSRGEGKDNEYDSKKNNTCNIGGKSLAEVADLLVDKDRHVNATTNNQNSSRSHTLLFITFTDANEKKFVIVIGDFAGVENIFSCDDLKVYIDFANLNVDKTAATTNDSDKKYYVSKNNNDANRDEIYDFADRTKLYKFIGDNKPDNAQVGNEISVQKSVWVEKLYRALLKNFNSQIDFSNITRELVAKFGDASTKSNFNLEQIKSLFKTKNYGNGSQIPSIISQIQNENAIKGSDTISLPKKTGFSRKNSDQIETHYNLEHAGYPDKTISLIEVYNELNNNNKEWLTTPFLQLKGHIFYTQATSSGVGGAKPAVKYVIIDNNDKGGVTGFRFKIVDTNKLSVQKLSSTASSGTSNPNLPEEKFTLFDQDDDSVFNTDNSTNCKAELCASLSNSNVNINVVLTKKMIVELPTDKLSFDKMVTDAKADFDNLETKLNAWKTGGKSIEFYAKCTNKGLPMKVKIDGELSSFDENVPSEQAAANAMVAANEKAQFVTDLDNVHKEIQRHKEIMNVVIPHCQLRRAETLFINTELKYLSNAVDAVYSMKNSGQPLLPNFVPGNNDFFENRHIFKVLDKVVYTADTFKKVVEKSMIMKEIFKMCETVGFFGNNSNNSSAAGGGSSSDKNGTDNANYEKFANALSVVYFLVFDLSRNSEKDNKIQYIQINDLFDLLRDVEYDMELETLELVDFATKKKEYIDKFIEILNIIIDYFHKNEINTGFTPQPPLTKKIEEITSMFHAIHNKFEPLQKANSYSDFHKILGEIVEIIDTVNMITSIGTLQTVSRRMNGVKKLVVQNQILQIESK